MSEFIDLTDLDADSLVKMLKGAFALEDWDNMINIANKLYEVINSIHSNQTLHILRLERPLPYYFGFSQLSKGIALQKIKKYDEARACIKNYSDLSYLVPLDEKGKQVVSDFGEFAEANSFTLELLSGNDAVLPAYIQFIEHKSLEEKLSFILTLLEAANEHNINVDHILDEFCPQFERYETSCTDATRTRYYMDYLTLLAVYWVKKGNYNLAIDIILKAIIWSDTLEDDRGFKKLVLLFELHREFASSSQKNAYFNEIKTISERMLFK